MAVIHIRRRVRPIQNTVASGRRRVYGRVSARWLAASALQLAWPTKRPNGHAVCDVGSVVAGNYGDFSNISESLPKQRPPVHDRWGQG